MEKEEKGKGPRFNIKSSQILSCELEVQYQTPSSLISESVTWYELAEAGRIGKSLKPIVRTMLIYLSVSNQ